VVLRTPDSASGSETGRFAGIGTRLTDNIFIAAYNVVYKSRWYYGHYCYQNTGYDIVSGRALGNEFDVTKADNRAPEFILSVVGRLAEAPDIYFVKVDPRFSDNDPNARSGAPYSGIHWPRPPRRTTTREPEKPKPKVPVPIAQPLYAMPEQTLIRESRFGYKDCFIYTYALITDKGVKKAKYEKHPVQHVGQSKVPHHFRTLSSFPLVRNIHFLEFTPKDSNTFMSMNEGAPIFCGWKFSFIVIMLRDTKTLVAISIPDNRQIVDIIKQRYPNRAKLPIYKD